MLHLILCKMFPLFVGFLTTKCLYADTRLFLEITLKIHYWFSGSVIAFL
jgi:hypothetical protein